MNICDFMYKHFVPNKCKPKAPIAYNSETIKLIEMTHRESHDNEAVNNKQYYNNKIIDLMKRR